jgi:hypothetical protein
MIQHARPVAGDVGTEFRLACRDESGAVANLTSLASARILFTRPDRSVFAKTATVVAPATGGVVRATWEAGDCREIDSGTWTIQAELTFSNSLVFSTLTQRFSVADKAAI